MDQTRLNQLLDYLKSDPEDSFLVFAVAKEYENLNLLDNALKYYLNLKKINPDYIGLYYHLGKFYEKIEEKRLANTTYTEGIELAKKQGDFHALSELNNARMNLEIELGN